MKKLFLVSLICCLLFPLTAHGNNILFVLFDAGETNGLLPVISKLMADKSSEVTIIAEGASTTILTQKGIAHKSIGDYAGSGGLQYNQAKENIIYHHDLGYVLPLRTLSMKKLSRQIMAECAPDALVTGLVSYLERDCLEAAVEVGIPAYGFYDFYDLPATDSIFFRSGKKCKSSPRSHGSNSPTPRDYFSKNRYSFHGSSALFQISGSV